MLLNPISFDIFIWDEREYWNIIKKRFQLIKFGDHFVICRKAFAFNIYYNNGITFLVMAF